MFCKICNKYIEIEQHMFTRLHLKHIHNISSQDYYDAYFKSDNDGICHNETCNNKTKYNDLSNGYNTFCCKKCASTSKFRKDKIAETNLKRYCVSNTSMLSEIQEKTKQTNIIRYGGVAPIASNIVKQKIKNTLLNNYGITHPMHSIEIKDKLKQSNIDKYGVDNVFKSEFIKNKIITTNNEKYGVDYPLLNENIRNKGNQTNLTRYGNIYPIRNSDIKEKSKLTLVNKYGTANIQSVPSVYNKSLKTHRKNYWDIFNIQLNHKQLSLLFDYDYFIDINNKTFDIKCNICNKCFTVNETNTQKISCTCQTYRSKYEQEISDWLKSIGITNISQNKRYNGRELDLYLDDYNLGIDFHGLYWHSDINIDKNYHALKLAHFESMNIKYVQILESEWLNKPNIIKNIIKARLNISRTKIFARKCAIRTISTSEYKLFMEIHHIQGHINALHKYGLFFNNILVSVMSFSKSRYSNHTDWELMRFANATDIIVIGGAEKLLSHFIKDIKPKSIISFCDIRLFPGSVYKSLGFILSHRSEPNYFYFKKNNTILESRIKYQKHKLKNLLTTYDDNLTEYQNMLNNGYLRIFDAGNDLY